MCARASTPREELTSVVDGGVDERVLAGDDDPRLHGEVHEVAVLWIRGACMRGG